MTLDQIDKDAARAFADFQHTNSLAKHFLDSLRASCEKKLPSGTSLAVHEDQISGNFFGVEILSVCRVVVVANRFRALEWTFWGELSHSQASLLTVYQWGDGVLSSSSNYDAADESNDTVVCDVNNSYLAKNLIGLMLPKLIASEIFTPNR